jgi:hypothetical protein
MSQDLSTDGTSKTVNIKWDELTHQQQEECFKRALWLINNGYIEGDLEEVAKKIYYGG